MINKKLKLWKRVAAFVLSFMLLIPSVALAKDVDISGNASETEFVQVDLNAELEKAMQENDILEDEMPDGTGILLGSDENDISEKDNLEADGDILGTDTPDIKEKIPANEDIPDEDVFSDSVEDTEIADSQMEISARGVSMPVTELYIK